MRVQASITIAAPQTVVFDRLADLERMSELSPECEKVRWLAGDGTSVGDMFRGWNRAGPVQWWTHGWITAHERPHRLVVETSTIYGQRKEPTNRWSYELTPEPGGTRVVECLETLRLPIHLRLLGPLLALRSLQLRAGIRHTLQALQRELEAPQAQVADD